MQEPALSDPSAEGAGAAADRYLLLVDISGYTAFLAGVERSHGTDFSGGIPAGYSVLGELLAGVIESLAPDFEVIKLEGDAVFGAAPAARLDGLGDRVVEQLLALYRTFVNRRHAARIASDDQCTACTAVSALDLKMILHRGMTVRQQVGATSDLLGPAVNVAHRLLKNGVRDRFGLRPYVLLTGAAATALGHPDIGMGHRETYPDVGPIDSRIVDLAAVPGWTDAMTPEGTALPQIDFR
jgi:class 3 adenylate cyclase